MIQFLLEIVYKLFTSICIIYTLTHICVYIYDYITAKIEINMPQFLFSNIEWEWVMNINTGKDMKNI